MTVESRAPEGAHLSFSNEMSYGDYLGLDQLLDSQRPLSGEHNELLFIIQHQTTELWLKLILHELDSARDLLAVDRPKEALKRIARIKHIQECITQQWSVLATLTPAEYAEFRGELGASSGFQSVQYRAVEFALGNKNREMLKVFRDDPVALALLTAQLERPSLYDEVLRYAARQGLAVPASVLERDVTEPYRETPELIPVFEDIYNGATENWDFYEICEELVDVEDNFQFWRFRHLRTVMRIIGWKVGTGGSSGVDFLKRALDLTFFPELYSVRTRIGAK